jgi:hypothetical protein
MSAFVSPIAACALRLRRVIVASTRTAFSLLFLLLFRDVELDLKEDMTTAADKVILLSHPIIERQCLGVARPCE